LFALQPPNFHRSGGSILSARKRSIQRLGFAFSALLLIVGVPDKGSAKLSQPGQPTQGQLQPNAAPAERTATQQAQQQQKKIDEKAEPIF